MTLDDYVTSTLMYYYNVCIIYVLCFYVFDGFDLACILQHESGQHLTSMRFWIRAYALSVKFTSLLLLQQNIMYHWSNNVDNTKPFILNEFHSYLTRSIVYIYNMFE